MLSEMLSLYSWHANPKEFPSSPSSDLFDVEHLIGQNQCKVVDLIIMFSENLKITFLENSGRIGQIFFFLLLMMVPVTVCVWRSEGKGQRTTCRSKFFLFPP